MNDDKVNDGVVTVAVDLDGDGEPDVVFTIYHKILGVVGSIIAAIAMALQ